MAAVLGTDFLITVSDATDGTFHELKGQRNGSYDWTNGIVETTTRDNSGVQQNIIGISSWGFSADGVTASSGAASSGLVLVENAIASGIDLWGVVTDTFGSTSSGQMLVTSYSESAAQDGTQEWNASFAGTSSITEAATP